MAACLAELLVEHLGGAAALEGGDRVDQLAERDGGIDLGPGGLVSRVPGHQQGLGGRQHGGEQAAEHAAARVRIAERAASTTPRSIGEQAHHLARQTGGRKLLLVEAEDAHHLEGGEGEGLEAGDDDAASTEDPRVLPSLRHR